MTWQSETHDSSAERIPRGANCAWEETEAVFFPPGSLIIMVGDDSLLRDQCVLPCGKPILLALSWALAWAPGDCDPGTMQDCEALDSL